MAGDPSGQLSWHLSGGTSNFNSDLSLGGARSNAQIRNNPTTVGSAGAAGDLRVYVASAVANSLNSVIYFRDGNCGGWYTEIIGVDDVSNYYDLLEPLPYSIGVGNTVWVYRKTYAVMPFKETTSAESSAGFTEYIGLYVTKSAGTWNDFRFWIEDSNPGPVRHAIAASDDNTHVLTTITDRWTEPNLAGMLASGGYGRWTEARHVNAGWPIFNYASGNVGFWLRRISPANHFRLSTQWLAIVAESPTSGYSSRCVLVWNTAGWTPQITLTHAPTVYLRGGARFKALVRAQETGLPVVGAPIGWAKTAGSGVLTPPPAPILTDENGISLARYAAPVDVGEIDTTFTVEASV